MSKYRIGIDVGGTFTDLVAVDEQGKVHFTKAASTPEDQSNGVMVALQQMAEQLNLKLPTLLARTERIVHGMTVATNALLERKGAKVGLLTTAGHRDVLEMREGLKPERYNLRLARQEPLVPRYLRLGVRERMRADGSIEIPLDHSSLQQAIAILKEEQVGAVAVCYLHAYKDARHEQMTAEVLASELPDVYLSLSSQVLPQIKEYERLSTTVINAYVGPLMAGYLSRFEQELQQAGYQGQILVILSHGGVAPIEEAIRIAAGTVLSGPAGGLAGARHVAKFTDIPDLITFDMGGTSSDISLVANGQASLATDRVIANDRIALSSLDIITLGAGGGSIAKIDSGGLLQVGPESAGAVPGPVCYAQGGMQATVTDANVVLGYLDPNNFLGGRNRLDKSAAEQALQQLGEQLGVDTLHAAQGVHRVVNTRMAEGIRLATVRRGVDPRRFTLLGFGGAAGLHATGLARMLDLKRIVIPRVASVLSAWGMLTTELRYEKTQSQVAETASLDAESLRQLYQQLEHASRMRMKDWFAGEVNTLRSADMRYGEQIYEIDVSLEQVDFQSEDLLQQIKQAFEKRHEALYTYSLKEQEPVLINARIACIGTFATLAEEPVALQQPVSTPIGQRQIYLGQWLDVDVYDFDTLASGQTIAGPAIVESATTTVLLRSGDSALVTSQQWLDIACG